MPTHDLHVEVRSEVARYSYGEPLRLRYTVENVSSETRLVVTRSLLAEAESADELFVLVGEVAPPRGFFYFEFAKPRLTALAAHSVRDFPLHIALPLLETEVDAEGTASDVVVDVYGAVAIVLQVGFLCAPFRPRGADPWGEFVALQELSAPASTRVHVDARSSI